MTTRVFNRTGRMRILEEDVDLEIHPDRSGFLIKSLTGSSGWHDGFDLASRREARVFLDIRARMYADRFDLGNLDSVVDGAWGGTDQSLPSQLQDPDVAFSVQITVARRPSGSEGGLILARSEPIRFGTDRKDGQAAADSLLRVQPEELGAQIWRLEFDGVGPILLMNSGLRDWHRVAREQIFRLAILPALLRDIIFEMSIYDRELNWMEEWARIPVIKSAFDDKEPIDDGETSERIQAHRRFADETTARLCHALGSGDTSLLRVFQQSFDTYVEALQ